MTNVYSGKRASRRVWPALFFLLYCVPAAAQETIYFGQSLTNRDVRWVTADYLPVFEAARGGYDWTAADRFVTRAQKRGLRILARPYLRSGRPATAEAYRAMLAAAVERYDRDKCSDMPGLRYPVTDWVVDGALHPESARPDDPEALADFAAEAYVALRAANPRCTVILAVGPCELQSDPEPIANAGYLESFFARLGARLAATSPRNLALGFHLVAETGAHAYLEPFAAFLRLQAERSRLGEIQFWLLDASLSEPEAAVYAAEMFKIHLCGAAAGFREVIYAVPLPAEALDRDLDAEYAAFQRAHRRSFTDEAFSMLASAQYGVKEQPIHTWRQGERWVLRVTDPQAACFVAWNDRPETGSEDAVEVEIQNGYVRVESLSPDQRIVTSTGAIVLGQVSIPASAYPTMITITKNPDDCHCQR